jgi:hypothetical protein
MSTRAGAALLLSVVVITFGLAMLRSSGSVAAIAVLPRVQDPVVYDRILARLRGGEGYYVVIGDELRSHGYATLEVFNWRTPLLWRSLARVPPPVRRGGLVALSLAAVIAATMAASRCGSVAALVTGVFGLGVVLMASAPGSVAMGEAWAGALMGISVSAYALERRAVGVTAGILAMFVRELVAPYTLVCAGVALAERRWREAAAWILGGIAYAVYYSIHLSAVWAHRLTTDLPGEGSWVAWGGLSFLLTTVQWNGLLLLAPWAAVATALAVIVAGVFTPTSPAHVRLSAAAYLLMFLIVGQPFDRYWGLLVWPVWALTCGHGAAAILGAVAGVRRRPPTAMRRAAIPGSE